MNDLQPLIDALLEEADRLSATTRKLIVIPKITTHGQTQTLRS